MTAKEKQQIIFKETARIIQEFAFVNNIKNIYEPFCSYMNVSKYITDLNRICTDINVEKISELSSLRVLSDDAIKDKIYNFMSILVSKTTEESYRELIFELLKLLFDEIYSEEISFNSLEDVINYNKEFHLERISTGDISIINETTFGVCKYNQLKLKNNSIILMYPPFKKSNILEETFNHSEMFKWINSIMNSNSYKNIHVLLLAKEATEDFIDYTDFSDKIKTNKKDKNNIKLYIHKNSELLNYSENEESELDF